MSGRKRGENSLDTVINGIRLGEGFKAKLMALAAKEKRSIASQVSWIIEDYLRRHGGAVGGE